ncbi:MAG: PDZ domain-containing protein [Patescibacteria group bacterium]
MLKKFVPQLPVVLLILTALLLIVFVSMYGQEKAARQETATALYETVWGAMKEKGDSLDVYYSKIPADARPGFLGFVAADMKADMATDNQKIGEFLNSIPQKGIGINFGVLPLSWPNGNSGVAVFGIRIIDVFAGSPASRAGLCAGDQILAIDGDAMNVSSPLDQVAEQTKALTDRAKANIKGNEQTIVMNVARGGKNITVRISEHNAFEHLRDHAKVMNDWMLASQTARAKFELALKRIEDLSEAPGTTPIIRFGINMVATTLKEVLQYRNELRDLRMKFLEGLQPFAPECKK